MKIKPVAVKYAFLILVVALLFPIGSCGKKAPREQAGKRVLVIGFDGMDPKLLDEFRKDRKFPNIEKLLAVNSVKTLRTSTPPQSPVAWSNFITSKNPGGHGIFDFIARDPETYLPYLSTSETMPPAKTITIGKMVFPVSKGKVELLRHGAAFWELLEKKGVRSTIFRVPSNYPPVKYGRSLSGMGTPDLLGGYGSFTFCTDTAPPHSDEITGGQVFLTKKKNGNYRCEVEGPENSFIKDKAPTKAVFDVWVDPENRSAKIKIGKESFMLNEGEWSGWIRLEFPLIKRLYNVTGIVLVYLKQTRPHFEMYISPVNIDPIRPALPISNPSGYSKELAGKIGYFYTQGMPEATKALDHGIFTDQEFVRQAGIFEAEIDKIYDYELSRFNSGFMFFYFSDTDLKTHMFWSATDPTHPQYPKRSEFARSVLPDAYSKMDRLLGKAMKRLGRNDTIIVISDHGFTSFARAFNLNTWLKENGYLAVIDEFTQDRHEYLENIDWPRTKAYAIGFNSLYINLAGREGQGIVPPGAARKELMEEIRQRLLELFDPDTGKMPISDVYFADDIYSKEYRENAPDMIIGYNPGYRASWETAIGKAPLVLFTDNTQKWAGDHCVDSIHVPGVIFSNRKIRVADPALTDIGVTVLSEFGIKKSPGMIGRPIF